MSSSLRVNTIVPSTGTNVAIGTANGTVTFTDSVNFVLGTGSSIFSPASNTLTFGTNDAERLRITSDGDVKIKSFGNASNGSADALQIGKTDNNYGITILSATNAQGRIDFTDTEDTNDPQGKIAYYHDSNSLQFFTNGGAASNERLRIDSAGTIKCGTSSTLKAEINSAIGGHQFISQCSDNNNGFEIYQQHGSTTTRNTFAVYANTGAGGSQELQFSIRGDGCVTKPKSPAFAARRSGNINISTNGNTDVVFNDELIDNGNNYNPSNGRFTASIAGTYYFGVNLYAGFSVTAVRVMHSTFNKNGSSYATVDLFGGVSNAAGTHYHPTGSSGMLIDLNVNDYVTFNLGTLSVTGSGNTFLYGTNGTRFFGYLVG